MYGRAHRSGQRPADTSHRVPARAQPGDRHREIGLPPLVRPDDDDLRRLRLPRRPAAHLMPGRPGAPVQRHDRAPAPARLTGRSQQRGGVRTARALDRRRDTSRHRPRDMRIIKRAVPRRRYDRILIAAALVLTPSTAYRWPTTRIADNPSPARSGPASRWPGKVGEPDYYCTDMVRRRTATGLAGAHPHAGIQRFTGHPALQVARTTSRRASLTAMRTSLFKPRNSMVRTWRFEQSARQAPQRVSRFDLDSRRRRARPRPESPCT
jgi:hypothetical protein